MENKEHCRVRFDFSDLLDPTNNVHSSPLENFFSNLDEAKEFIEKDWMKEIERYTYWIDIISANYKDLAKIINTELNKSIQYNILSDEGKGLYERTFYLVKFAETNSIFTDKFEIIDTIKVYNRSKDFVRVDRISSSIVIDNDNVMYYEQPLSS